MTVSSTSRPVPASDGPQEFPQTEPVEESALGQDARTGGLTTALERGVGLLQSGNLVEAERIFREILEKQPAHFEALYRLSIVCSQRGDHEEVLRLLDAALRIDPGAPFVFYRRAGALQSLNRHQEALASCDRAISLKPDYAQALNRRGVILARLQRFGEALASLDRALAITPDSAEVMTNRGNVLSELERPDEAVASYDKALALNPGSSGTLYCRALALAQQNRLGEALASFDNSLAIARDNTDAWTHRGNVLHGLKRFEEALESYDKALAVGPGRANTLNDRGAALVELGRFDEAIASYKAALSLKPDSAETWNNLGLALVALKRFDDALASYGRATAINPDLAEAHFDESLCRLLIGDFRRGWEEYEWRWKRKDRRWKIRDFPQPKWLGDEDISGRRILLHTEQGLGDTIQFCRYASLAAERGARVILVVQPPLRSLFESLPAPMEVLPEGEPLPAFDLHCPLPSLPLAFRTTLDNIPARVPYLTASEERVKFWRAKLGGSERPRVGLVWSGHPEHRNDRDRSLPLNALMPLIRELDELFSLQKEIRDPDREVLESIGTIRHFGDELTDFCDTAALVQLMDVVISADTSVAHLAGAMGKPVWILVPYSPDWRWLLDREDSPWYPTARLFRQSRRGDWAGVVERVAEELRRLKAGA